MKIANVNVKFEGTENIEQDPLLFDNPNTKIVVLEMIYQTIKNHSQTVRQNMIEISFNYR